MNTNEFIDAFIPYTQNPRVGTLFKIDASGDQLI